MYEEDEQSYTSKDKEITFYRNGNNEKAFVLTLKKYDQFKSEVIKKFGFEPNSEVRFFTDLGNIQYLGVEIFEDDLKYCKNKQALYVSRGEEYDQNSQFQDYKIIKQIGEGGFGRVMLGEHKETKEKVAIKIINTKMIGIYLNLGNAQDIDMVFMEAELLKTLHHKNIVSIKKFLALDNMQVVFIMEYCCGGELLEYVVKKQKLCEEEAKFFFRQIAEALYYLHREKLIHRDLKLENLLLTDPETKQIKIVDFGISGLSNIQLDNQDAGSLKYMAPEILLKKKNSITPALDIWSLGVILYTMIVGQLPFDGKSSSEIIDKIVNEQYHIPIEIEKNLSPEIFYKECQKKIQVLELIQMIFKIILF